MKTASQLENMLIVKELKIQKLNIRINELEDVIKHAITLLKIIYLSDDIKILKKDLEKITNVIDILEKEVK